MKKTIRLEASTSTPKKMSPLSEAAKNVSLEDKKLKPLPYKNPKIAREYEGMSASDVYSFGASKLELFLKERLLSLAYADKLFLLSELKRVIGIQSDVVINEVFLVLQRRGFKIQKKVETTFDNHLPKMVVAYKFYLPSPPSEAASVAPPSKEIQNLRVLAKKL